MKRGGSVVLVSSAAARLGLPHHEAIAWFLAAEQAWVTGQVLGVDGGLASVRARPTA